MWKIYSFEIYKDYLIKDGVKKIKIISINFEDMEYEGNSLIIKTLWIYKI